jgi:hypothetical protein
MNRHLLQKMRQRLLQLPLRLQQLRPLKKHRPHLQQQQQLPLHLRQLLLLLLPKSQLLLLLLPKSQLLLLLLQLRMQLQQR